VFEFAFIGTLLLHLRNPVDALAAIRRVLRPGGQLMSNDVVSVSLSLLRSRRPTVDVAMQSPRPFWYVPNRAAHLQFVKAAGYEILSSGGPYLMRYGSGWQPIGAARSMEQLVKRRGGPHAWIIARPLGEDARPTI
jgi:hypothetical protein